LRRGFRAAREKEKLMAVNYKPAETQNVIPYLVVPDADKELAFVKAVFGAKEVHISRDPSGHIVHAQVKIGDSMVMMAQAGEHWPALPAAIYIYVPDVDAAHKRALASGATSVMEPADQFYGDRNSGVKNSNGMQWWIGAHIEDVSEEELHRRAAEAFKKRAQAGA
jgi:PhnB protein